VGTLRKLRRTVHREGCSVPVSATALIQFQRNRYSEPCEWVNSVVSLRAYSGILRVVRAHGEVVNPPRSFERDQIFYDWQHYISLIERKPGTLRNGAPMRYG
jgi:hypothetical protein